MASRRSGSRGAAVMGGSTLLRLLAVLLAAAALPRAAAVKGLTDWSGGIITHFGGAQDGMDPSSPSFGTKDGSCGYGVIPKEQYPYFSTAALSPQNPYFTADDLHGCGQCFQIMCADDRGGVCKTDSAGKPLSIIAMISDSCPECEADHIDVQSLAFAKLADPGIGRVKMQYRRVECAPPEPMQVAVMDFKGPGGWLRLSITDTGGRAAVTSVAVKGSSGDWKEMANSWGATWELPSAPPAPLSFRITSDGGQVVEADDVITQSGGIASGAGASGSHPTFATGVQFSITDPAYGKVQAFDGPSDPMLVTSSTPGATDGAPGAPAASGPAASPAPGAPANKPPTSEPSAARSGSSPSPSPASASSSNGGCKDLPTPDGYSCAQQKAWGKCSQPWIAQNGYCKATCGACGGGSSTPKVQSASGPPAGGRKMLLR
ncbi:hypothetical protein ABPG75_003266 [Micractinium tetrahymenae]